ncbi:MAG: 50S ribosomal protein L3 [Candidatus Omnitrophota bacterium]
MMTGILGKKIGMTNIFDQEGRFVPVTLIEAGPCLVLDTKTKEKCGYSAVVLGYGQKKPARVKKPQKKWPVRVIKEIRMDRPASVKVGDKIGVNVFKGGDYVDITGKTIGKGFQGGMKRWGWHGGGKSHGSMFHRAPGSIGASSFPSRVHKGKTMPGHMGAVKRTAQNSRIVSVDEQKNILTVKGSVPGHKGSFLVIRHAKKKPVKDDGKGKK